MCKGNQMPVQDEHFSPDNLPLEGWDEVDRTIAAAVAILKGLDEKHASGHVVRPMGPGWEDSK